MNCYHFSVKYLPIRSLRAEIASTLFSISSCNCLKSVSCGVSGNSISEGSGKHSLDNAGDIGLNSFSELHSADSLKNETI